jgi:hypothetical protein
MSKLRLNSSFGNIRPDVLIDRAFDGFSRIAIHEAESLDGHWLALRERLAVARKARGVGELVRNQIDLLPETRNRVLHDHRVRRDLWRGLAQTFSLRDDEHSTRA